MCACVVGIHIKVCNGMPAEMCIYLNPFFQMGSLYMVHTLVEAGADVDLVDADGKSCTHYAAEAGQPHVLHYLWERCSIDLSVKDKM